MRYTTDDKGVRNNCAIEPVVTIAEYPATVEQHYFFRQSAIVPVLTKSQFAALKILATTEKAFAAS